jgi:hypothetical protein
MAPQVHLKPLDERLRGQLFRVITVQREKGLSWRMVARYLDRRYDVVVDGRTVQSWYESKNGLGD